MSGNNWVTHAEWQAGALISRFVTTWRVPPAPSSPLANTGVLPVFMFNGLTYSWNNKGVMQSMILQPVLTFGANGDQPGTGRWWSVSSWFAPNKKEHEYLTSPGDAGKVYPGDVVTGEMTQINLAGGRCDLVCVFRDANNAVITGSELRVTGKDVTPNNVCQIALEVYDKSTPQAYPTVFRTAMIRNVIETGGPINPVQLQPAWVPKEENVQQWGEHSVITRVANPSAVDLCYGFVAPPSMTAVGLGNNIFVICGIDSNDHLMLCTVSNGFATWQVLGQTRWTSPPTAVLSAPNTVDVFGLAPDSANRDINTAQWVRIQSGAASPPRSLGQNFSCNVAAILINNQVEIFGVLLGGQMIHTRIDTGGKWTGTWNTFPQPPHFMATPTPVSYAPGKLKVLGLSNENSNVRDNEFNIGSGKPGDTWDIATDSSMCNPSVVNLGNGRACLFTIYRNSRADMQLINRIFLQSEDRWIDEATIDMPRGPGGPPIAISAQPNSVELFLLDRAGGMWYRQGDIPDDFITWKPWQVVPLTQGQIITSLPTLVVPSAGVIQVFLRNANNQLFMKTFNRNTNTWSLDQLLVGGDISGF